MGQGAMENGHRVSRKVRKLGSNRRRQTREPADGQDAPVATEPESWSSQTAVELQDFFQDCGAKERGFVTREDMAAAKFSFLGSEEEPEMIFDWMDMERKGRLSLEEFSSGLKSIFGSSLSTHRLRRRRPLPSKRRSAAASFPALEEANTEEKEAFLAFMEKLGPSHLLPEQAEIWQLWWKLRQEEPHLAGNLEGFLAKMISRLQEVRADKEALELSLRKRDSDHHREVQELYEEMEQQIRREKQQLQAESNSRDVALSLQMQEVLEAKEREVQRLAEGQRELQAQLDHLSSTHQEANSENQQLREAEKDLVGQLKEVQGQLQVTRGHLKAAKGRVSWQVEEEEPSVPRAVEEKAPAPQAISPEESSLPRLFGDNDSWDQLLSFSSPPLRPLQLSWSPPPTPRAPSAPDTPRVVRQISISGPQALPFGQKPSSEPDGASRSPPGGTCRAEEGRGGDPDGQDINSEQPMEPPGLEAKGEPRPDPESYFRWDLLGAPAGQSGGPVAATLKVLIHSEDGSLPHVEPPPLQAPAGPSELPPASDPDDKGPKPGPAPVKPHRQREAFHQDPHTAGSEPGLGPLGAGILTLEPAKPSQGQEPVAPKEGLEPRKPGPDEQEGHSGRLREAHVQALGPGGPPSLHHQSLEKEPWAGEGKQEDRAAQAEGGQGLPQSGEPRAESRPEDPGTESRKAGQPPLPGDLPANEPQDDPDYIFHVIFLGDSNVGKTSFLHLLHQNSFAAGLTATVGVDFRVKILLVDNKRFALQLWDTAGQERYHSMTRQLLRKADGVVLMYDVTDQESFAHVRYWLDCLQDAGSDKVTVLLLGNKMDCEEERQVPTEAGERLAEELGVSFGECSAALGHNILEPIVNLARSLKVQEDLLRGSLVEVVPKRPPKRTGCCS
ncbi:ras-related protein Rab-44 isoform X5 [Loxodonta africana]|uniref:ras-related protein Rab-44 isoform X5 n=1 Tax=Loxodonta africana TaxID=9785 RepID=UPI0030CC3743